MPLGIVAGRNEIMGGKRRGIGGISPFSLGPYGQYSLIIRTCPRSVGMWLRRIIMAHSVWSDNVFVLPLERVGVVEHHMFTIFPGIGPR